MARWEPDAEERLREAAMELFLERGYEQTTVADIAASAGLTARTFFRYFTDKREVLFAGSTILQETMAAAVAAAPAEATPMEAVAAALDAIAPFLGRDRAFSRRRQSIVEANAELRERELIKMATLARTLADGLKQRGVKDPDASLAAEAGIAVFRVAFARWVTQARKQDLAEVMRESLDQLRAVTSR